MKWKVVNFFFQIQNFSTKNDVDFYILGHLHTILANNSNQMCNLFVISNISHLINFVCQIHGRTTFVLNTLNPQRKCLLCKFLEHEDKSWKYWTLIGCVEVVKNYFVSFSRNNTTKTYLATFLLLFFKITCCRMLCHLTSSMYNQNVRKKIALSNSIICICLCTCYF